ncbi:chlorophyll A-B binding protein [Aureococcus anophagefferens]|nr:chlorophyll A-B binding protein [Aureococcus anophagefferens]
MKVLVAIGLVSRVAGFAPVVAPAATTALNAEMSKALPFLMQPKGLTGYVGAEAGFDPLGFAEIMDIKWMREAEIKHGRVAMLATIGYTYPEAPWAVQAFPGDAYSHANPIKAAIAVPPGAWANIIFFVGLMEFATNRGKMTMMEMFEDPFAATASVEPVAPPLRASKPFAHSGNARARHGFVTGCGVFGSTNQAGDPRAAARRGGGRP